MRLRNDEGGPPVYRSLLTHSLSQSDRQFLYYITSKYLHVWPAMQLNWKTAGKSLVDLAVVRFTLATLKFRIDFFLSAHGMEQS